MTHDDIMTTASHYSEVDAQGYVKFCEDDLINFAQAILARAIAQPVEQTAVGTFECTHYDAFTEAHKQVAAEVNALRETLGMKAVAQPVEQMRALTDTQRNALEYAAAILENRGRTADFRAIQSLLTAARPASGETE